MSTDLRLRTAAHVLRAGGVVAYPTESVYGLGCDPMDTAAVARIVQMKRRSPTAGFILLASDTSQLTPYVDATQEQMAVASDSWPGPITWILPATSVVPALITGGRETVAVRVTAHERAAALCEETGFAILSTSANRSGHPPARSALQVRCWFGADVDFVLAGPTGKAPGPTEIRDAATGTVLRAGHRER